MTAPLDLGALREYHLREPRGCSFFTSPNGSCDCGLFDVLSTLIAEAEQARRYREALEFYADTDKVPGDAGLRARDALAAPEARE